MGFSASEMASIKQWLKEAGGRNTAETKLMLKDEAHEGGALVPVQGAPSSSSSSAMICPGAATSSSNDRRGKTEQPNASMLRFFGRKPSRG